MENIQQEPVKEVSSPSLETLLATETPEAKKKKKKKKKKLLTTGEVVVTEQPATGLAALSNLQQRLIAGVIGGAGIIGAVYWNQYSFFFLFFGITLLSMKEFYTLLLTDDKNPNVWAGIVIGMSMFVLTFLIQIDYLNYKAFMFVSPIVCLLFIRELYINKKKPFNNVAFTVLGLLYVAIPFCMIIIAAFSRGAYSYQIVLGCLFLLWASDSGAYFAGRTLGKTKLFERISPKKTWEGSIGGALLSLSVAFVLSHYYPILKLQDWIILSSIIVVVGSYGDLVESSFKRSLKLKDSGSLIPGHGGFLDRFDGLLLAAPFIAVYLKMF